MPSTGSRLELGSNAHIVLVESPAGVPLIPLGENEPEDSADGGGSGGETAHTGQLPGGELGWGAFVLSAEADAGDPLDPPLDTGGALEPLSGRPTRLYGSLRTGPEGSVRSNGF